MTSLPNTSRSDASTRQRRAKGEGTVFYDQVKRLWYGRWTRADGSKVKTRGQDTESEALLALQDERYEERHGLRPRQQNHRRTVGDAIDAWLTTVASQKAASTRAEYERTAKAVGDALGRIHLEDLTRQHVKAYANTLRKTLRRGTVRKYLTVLQMVLAEAVNDGWIGTNVAQRISIKADEDPITVDGLTDEESDRLLEAAAGRSMENMLTVGVWTGLRKGELLGLRWRDIDVARGRLYVRQTLVWRSGQPWDFKATPKTHAGRRGFPLLPVIAAALDNQRARVAQLRADHADLWTEYDLVFPSEIGTPTHPANVNRELAKLEQLAGVEHHRVHDWRHTAATKLLTAGVPDRIVMEVCGWSDRAMLDRYQHVSDAHMDELVERVITRFPAAAEAGPLRLPTRSKFAGRPHSRRKGARLEAAR
jgi:integrase